MMTGIATAPIDVDRASPPDRWSLDIHDVLIQPTTFCNINCSYCYLPNRRTAQTMSVRTAEAIAHRVSELGGPAHVLWHSGEPLAAGFRRFVALHDAFARYAGRAWHFIQSNGTLIDDQWCDLFTERKIHVSISLDGPRPANARRLDWRGATTFGRALAGLRLLIERGLKPPVLVTVDACNLGRAVEIYRFFADLGVLYIGVNIVEAEGTHGAGVSDEEGVRRFWEELWNARMAAREGPEVREFRTALERLRAFCDAAEDARATRNVVELVPSVAWDGRVKLLAPELLGADCARLGDFWVGAIEDVSFRDLAAVAAQSAFVREALAGMSACKRSCRYWTFCDARRFIGNRYVQHGRLDVAETQDCRNSVQSLMEVVLERLGAPERPDQEAPGYDTDLWRRLVQWDLGFLERRLLARGGYEDEELARRHVQELRKFLYLCAVEGETAMTSGAIDGVWHELILFTREYAELCDAVFGRYIHHRPGASDAPREAVAHGGFAEKYERWFGPLDAAWPR